MAKWLNRFGLTMLICLLAATGAQAQSSGGHRHGGRGGQPSGDSDAPRAQPRGPIPNPVPVEKTDIVGVVQAIDATAGRVTIAYEAVEARNWPPGAMPFVVERPSLLAGVTVGEKVRFRVESEQITDLGPYVPHPAADSEGGDRPAQMRARSSD
jgi:hypothetical protein